LVERLLGGDAAALARLLSHVERGDALGEAAVDRLYADTGRAHIVGITGPPGAGKSTLTNALIGAFRARDRRVGVVAIDPSSPIAGGAALGDRIRMGEWHADPGVFVRSMAARGHPGGLAPAAADAIHLLDAAGFDPILIETVGVGQGEIAVAGASHTVIVVQGPGFGDGVQALKAGLLEIADVLAVNKADQPGAAEVARLLRDELGAFHVGGRTPPVLLVSAIAGDGVEQLAGEIGAHLAHLRDTGGLAERQRQIAGADVLARVDAVLRGRLGGQSGWGGTADELLREVAVRTTSPAAAAAVLLGRLAQ